VGVGWFTPEIEEAYQFQGNGRKTKWEGVGRASMKARDKIRILIDEMNGAAGRAGKLLRSEQ